MYIHACIMHYNVLLEMMMSVLQEIKGLTKELYFTGGEVQFPCKISGPLIICFTCFDINMACIVRTDNHNLVNYMPMH